MLGHFVNAHKLLYVGSILLGCPHHGAFVEVGDDVLIVPRTLSEVVGAADDAAYTPVLLNGEAAGLHHGILAAQVGVDAEGTFAVEHDIEVGAIGKCGLVQLGELPCAVEVLGVDGQGRLGSLLGGT